MSSLPLRSSWKALSAVLAATTLVAGLLPAVPLFASQVTADGLVGYWKFDETSAGTFADVSGHANTEQAMEVAVRITHHSLPVMFRVG